MARLKTKWNLDRRRTGGQTGGVVAVNIWHAVCEGLINLENENFETNTQLQRLEVLAEFCAFAVHVLDRMAYAALDDAGRADLVCATATRLAELIADNRRDADADAGNFIELLDRRGDEYAGCGFDEGPSFTMRRCFADHVRDRMGERDNKWVADYVIDAEAPRVYSALKRICAPLFKASSPSV